MQMVWLPAAIGAVSGLIVLILRDFLLPQIMEKKRRRATENDLFDEYLMPIVQSLEALMWRLNEILRESGRGVYLVQSGSGSHYAEYKRISTVYRICVAMGWFRAFERELLGVRYSQRTSRDKLRNALKEFQSSLADGKSVEMEKLDRLVGLLGWEEKLNENPKELVAIKIENLVDTELGDQKHLGLSNVDASKRRKVVEGVLALILDLEKLPMTLPLPEEAVDEAAEILSLRQTWIYRDWQAAIGDEMLLRADTEARRYDVIGFGEFEEKWAEQPQWLKRVSALVLDFDVGQVDSNDARRAQLEGILRTISGLLVSILDDDQNLSVAMPKALAKAREISVSD